MTQDFYQKFKTTQPGEIIKYTTDGSPIIKMTDEQYTFLKLVLKQKYNHQWLTDKDDACIIGDKICFRPFRKQKMRTICSVSDYNNYELNKI